MEPGLGNKWNDIIKVLEDIIPVYDRVNSFISFGKDEDLRYKGISKVVRENNTILDAGSGFGNMSKTVKKILGEKTRIIMYDPILQMLKGAESHFDTSPDLSCGVFEYLPFQNEQFDVVMCGYSIRDAQSLKVAISEMHRVLKNNGCWVIVDLGKPDNQIIRCGVAVYLRAILPLVACIIGGKLGLKFGALYETYKHWPQNKILKSLLLEKFSRVEYNTNVLGAAIMVAAYK